jgi:hypothetical protein
LTSAPAISDWHERERPTFAFLLPPSLAASLLAAFFVLSSLTACHMNNLPRNMNLKAFDPHRADFTCKYEADVNPPITPEAEALFQQGMVGHQLRALARQARLCQGGALWKQAAAMGHWKAAMNLAGLYEQGLGVDRRTPSKRCFLSKG